MTVQSAFEEIHELFPDITDTAIYRDLDSAQKEFCNETKILVGRGACSDISTNFGWNLPSNCIRAYDFRAYDSNGLPIYLGEEQLAWEVEFGKIYLYSLTSTPISATPSTISSLYVHYYKAPTAITAVGSSFTINEKYHKGIVAKVFAEYFAKYPTLVGDGGIKMRDWNAVNYWASIYAKHRLEAKRDANDMQGKTSGEGQQYDFAGKFELPLREYDSGVSSTLTGLSAFYSKYVILTAVEGETTGVNLGQYGYTGTITCAISGNTITVTSTDSDFGVYVQCDRTNNDINWTRTSGTTITLTGYTGWLRTKIFIYELPV